MGGRMVQRSGLTHTCVDLGLDRSPNAQAALGHNPMMQEGTASLGGVAHIETHACPFKETAVADLAAGFGVERRLVENHNALLAFFQAVHGLASGEQRDDLAAAAGALVTEERGVAVDLDQGVVIHTEGTGGTGALALSLHFALEAF